MLESDSEKYQRPHLARVARIIAGLNDDLTAADRDLIVSYMVLRTLTRLDQRLPDQPVQRHLRTCHRSLQRRACRRTHQ